MREDRDQLIMEHQGYVEALAVQLKKQLPARVLLEDLVASGQLGLIEAAENFDASRGAAFTTYAHYRIRGAMLDGVRKSTWLPPALRRKLDADAGANDLLEDAAGSGERETLDAQAKKFRDAVARLGAVYLMSHREDASDNLDPVTHDDPSAGLAKRELAQRLQKALATLGQPYRRVMEKMYFEHMTMTQIAAIEGCDKSTIHRWHRSAVEDLRRSLEGEIAPASRR
jgi:RNA polymerase sigma factor FliA